MARLSRISPALLYVLLVVVIVAGCNAPATQPSPTPTPAPATTTTPALAPTPTPTPSPTLAVPIPKPTPAPITKPTPTPTPTVTTTPQRTQPAAPSTPPPRGAALLDQAKGFPRAVLFRGAVESLARRSVPQTQVVALAANYDLIIANALDEEILGNQRAAPYLQAIKARFPEKIVLDQFLVEGRNALSTQPAVFPGHWLLLNGTTLTADVTRSDTVLRVTDSSVLRVGEAVQMTALDSAGRPDYSKVEQMRIVVVGPGTATVERAAYGSAPLEFKGGRARIAAHAWVKYGENEIWRYNFSLEAPRDPEGRRLIESLAQDLAGYLRPGSPLAGLDGYQFDVARFFTNSTNQGNRRLDCDNDGAPDSGFVNGVNSYGLGAVTFSRTLRGLVGEDILLLSEVTGPLSDRDIAYANGIENESFPDYHRWDLFSSAYQRYQYWLQHARSPRLSYLQLKETSEAFTSCPDNDRGTNWKYRLALAAALMGDGYFAYWPINEEGRPQCSFMDPVLRAPYAELDEFKAGRDNRWNYLGKALEEPRRLDMLGATKNLLTNGNFDSDLGGVKLATAGRARATMTRDEDQAAQGRASLLVSISELDPDPVDTGVQVSLGPFTAQAGKEYTLRLRVRADLKYDSVDPMFTGVPRRVVFALSVPGIPASSWVQQDVMADKEWREYWLAFVSPADSSNASIVVLVGKEGGNVWLDDLRLQPGPGDVFVRRFERGAVLMNASAKPVDFDMLTLFPGLTLRRISGTQDPAVNSGALVGPTVTVPGRDALILLTVEGS